ALAALLLQSAPASRPESASSMPAVAELRDSIVAIINDEVITRSELDAKVAPLIRTIANPDARRLTQARGEEVQKMAFEILLKQASKRLGINEEEIAARTKWMIDEDIRKAGGETQLRRIQESQGRSYADYERETHDAVVAERVQLEELGR